ncbi:MAG: FlgB family protein [Paracoccus sp. (in: a-proteobacteria)]|nr:FlgB family protein [Paracoccus sp. (in: a-proteobacteria)]
MLEKIETIQMARAMSAHAGQRAKLVAGNVANADTPGYLRRDLTPFSESYRSAGTSPMRATRAGHLEGQGAAASGARVVEGRTSQSPNGNSVSLEEEMVRTAEIKRQHETSLAVYRSSLTMLRSALGRRG